MQTLKQHACNTNNDYFQWLGDADLRAKMAGRLILIQMLCKDLAKDPTATDLKSVFTPCVAFRVAGTPSKYINSMYYNCNNLGNEY